MLRDTCYTFSASPRYPQPIPSKRCVRVLSSLSGVELLLKKEYDAAFTKGAAPGPRCWAQGPRALPWTCSLRSALSTAWCLLPAGSFVVLSLEEAYQREGSTAPPHSRPPLSWDKSGGADYQQKTPRPFWALLATPGRGQTISGAAAMAVPSSIGTGTPAPAIRLPLDPAPTHPRERPFRRNRACDLIFKRDRQRCGDGASPKRPVCHSHSPHPQLPT